MSQERRPIGRRELLRLGAMAAATGVVVRSAGAPSSRAGAASPVPSHAMLIDLSWCVGCRSCVYACQEANGWAGDPESPELSGDSWTAIREVSIPGDGGGDVRYVRTECFHCMQPSCADACIVGALRKTPSGPVVYDAGKCIGCRYCMIACPFQVPRYQWESASPLVAKCQFCAGRLAAGQQPACAEACPTGATLFGDRRAMLEEARRRLAEEPDKYVQHVYGAEEVGGTSWLFISDVPFEQLGFPDVGTTPPPAHTRAWMDRVPVLAAGIAGLLAAFHVFSPRGDDRA